MKGGYVVLFIKKPQEPKVMRRSWFFGIAKCGKKVDGWWTPE
jgi:hypothetical protein